MSIRTVGVVGAGAMGCGIAQVTAMDGRYAVILHDTDEAALDRGSGMIQQNLEKLVAKGSVTEEEKASVESRISGTADPAGLKQADMVIEAIVEKEEAKEAVFRQLGALCKKGTILATNTSSLSITRLASCAKEPSFFIGLHFFNPVPVMRLVEIVRGKETSRETTRRVTEFVTGLGKIPVEVKDSPGFVVNRLLIPLINEAAFLFQEGVAPAESVDAAMKLGANHPLGPLELADLIGLDVCLHIMEILHKDMGEDKYRPCPLLREYVAEGKLGRKVGQGFFSYPRVS